MFVIINSNKTLFSKFKFSINLLLIDKFNVCLESKIDYFSVIIFRITIYTLIKYKHVNIINVITFITNQTTFYLLVFVCTRVSTNDIKLQKTSINAVLQNL